MSKCIIYYKNMIRGGRIGESDRPEFIRKKNYLAYLVNLLFTRLGEGLIDDEDVIGEMESQEEIFTQFFRNYPNSATNKEQDAIYRLIEQTKNAVRPPQPPLPNTYRGS